MVTVSVLCLGVLVVFGVGCIVMYVALDAIANRRNGQGSNWWDYLIERDEGKLSLVGGGIAVALLLIFLFDMPKLGLVILIVLITLATLIGLFRLITDEPTKKARIKDNSVPASTIASPAQEGKIGQAASTKLPPPVEEDPYRVLLIKAKYDRSLVERLIEYERKRKPLASLDDLCRNAIVRWERDNQ